MIVPMPFTRTNERSTGLSFGWLTALLFWI